MKDSTRLTEQILSLGRQHALLDNHHRAFEGEHNELLRRVASLEKGLATVEKKRDEAVEALKESQKREEDLRASTVDREKVFIEQLFSVAKALSDAAGIDFDAQALTRTDALAGAVTAVEDHSISVKDTLEKAKGMLGRLREEMAPKAPMIENFDGFVESFVEGIPMDFKNSQRSVGATMALAMAQAHDVELDPARFPRRCRSLRMASR